MTDKQLFQPVLRATQLHLDVRVVVVKVEFGLVRTSTVTVRDFLHFTDLRTFENTSYSDIQFPMNSVSYKFPPLIN